MGAPPKSFCESHEHEMYWWGLPYGQFEVCAKCAFAVRLPDRSPVETEWSLVYDGVTGEELTHLAHWMPPGNPQASVPLA